MMNAMTNQGSFAAVERQGNFNVTDDFGNITTIQTVTSIERMRDSVKMSGLLSFSPSLPSSSLSPAVSLLTWKYEILFKEATDQRLDLSIKILPADDNNNDKNNLARSHISHIILEYRAERDEKVYGLGAQYTYLNAKGQKVPILVSEQGVSAQAFLLFFLKDENGLLSCLYHRPSLSSRERRRMRIHG